MVSSEMKSLRHTHRFLIYLCLAAVLVAALTHFGADLPALLIAVFWVFFALSIGPPTQGIEELCAIQPSPILPAGSPRPPPIQ
jgi:hypothetical protein